MVRVGFRHTRCQRKGGTGSWERARGRRAGLRKWGDSLLGTGGRARPKEQRLR